MPLKILKGDSPIGCYSRKQIALFFVKWELTFPALYREMLDFSLIELREGQGSSYFYHVF